MPGDIKSRFVLEGEQQFRSAMTNAANAIKVLNAEQKLAKAQFQNTGNAEKFAAQQTELLKQKIEQQKTAVKAAEQALKQLAQNGVSENSRQFQQWQTKLLNAQTALVNMETELNHVNDSLQETGDTANDTGNSLESIGKKVNYDAVISGIDKITDAMAAAIQKAKDLAVGLIDAMRDAGTWADDLVTQSLVYGVDTDTLQRMRYTATILDTSTDAIIRSRQKMISNMAAGAEAFEQLGVEFQIMAPGKNGPVLQGYRDWADVFWEVGDALANLEKTKGFEEASSMATKIFGKGWAELRPIFMSNWASESNFMGQAYSSAREYYEAISESWQTVSNENVGQLSAMQDSIDKLTNTWTTLKNTLLSALGPAFTKVTELITKLLGQLNEYLESDEGKEKLSELGEAVTNLFEGLSDIEFGTVIEMASNAITSLTDGLKWIGNHWGSVETGVKALGTVFAGLTVSKDVLTLLQLLAAGKFLFGGGAAAANAATGATAAKAAAGGGLLATIKTVLGAAVKTAPFVLPAALFGSSMVNNQLMLAEAAAAGQKSIEQYNAMSAEYAGSGAAYNMWSGFYRFFNVTGEDQHGEWMTEFAKHYVAWFNDEVEDATLDALSEELDKGMGAYDDFHDIMLRIANGEMFYSDEDRDALLMSMYDAMDALTAIMSREGQAPVEVPVEPEVPEDAAKQVSENVGVVPLKAVLTLTGMQFGSVSAEVGKHANGLWNVPWDGYPAILHKGERVLTARENQNYTYNNYFGNVNLNNGLEIEALTESLERRNARQRSGYGA